jgi:hypothetical protein
VPASGMVAVTVDVVPRPEVVTMRTFWTGEGAGTVDERVLLIGDCAVGAVGVTDERLAEATWPAIILDVDAVTEGKVAIDAEGLTTELSTGTVEVTTIVTKLVESPVVIVVMTV